MGRIPRWRMGKGVYHVFNRGINSAWILSSPDDRDFFIGLLAGQKRLHKIDIYHYVVMSNHFHLAVETLDTETLSAYIGKVSSLYSRYWHKSRGGGNGPVWQGRFKSLLVQKELYLNRLGRYIERNPVTAGVDGIGRPEDYEWSSASAYVSWRADGLADPSRHPHAAGWGDTAAERRGHYGRYIGDGRDDGERGLFTAEGGCLGDEKFKSNLKMAAGRLTSRKRGRPRKAQE
jgi:putative transposase